MMHGNHMCSQRTCCRKDAPGVFRASFANKPALLCGLSHSLRLHKDGLVSRNRRCRLMKNVPINVLSPRSWVAQNEAHPKHWVSTRLSELQQLLSVEPAHLSNVAQDRRYPRQSASSDLRLQHCQQRARCVSAQSVQMLEPPPAKLTFN